MSSCWKLPDVRTNCWKLWRERRRMQMTVWRKCGSRLWMFLGNMRITYLSEVSKRDCEKENVRVLHGRCVWKVFVVSNRRIIVNQMESLNVNYLMILIARVRVRDNNWLNNCLISCLIYNFFIIHAWWNYLAIPSLFRGKLCNKKKNFYSIQLLLSQCTIIILYVCIIEGKNLRNFFFFFEKYQNIDSSILLIVRTEYWKRIDAMIFNHIYVYLTISR